MRALESGENPSALLVSVRQRRQDVLRDDTTVGTICDGYDMLPENKESKIQNILWHILVQQNIVRPNEEAQSLLQEVALFKTRS